MVFIRTKDVEIFQADDFVQEAGALGVQIEQMLGVAIHVQRAQRVELGFVVFHALRAIAVSRGGRRINETSFVRERPTGQVFGELVIIFGEIGRILFGRGRARAEMKNQIKFAQRAALQTWQQISGFDIIRETQRREIAPFLIRAEDVADDDVVATAPVQLPDERAADEARAAGDQHPLFSPIIHEKLFCLRPGQTIRALAGGNQFFDLDRL